MEWSNSAILTKGRFLIFALVSCRFVKAPQILTEANDNAKSNWNSGVDFMMAVGLRKARKSEQLRALGRNYLLWMLVGSNKLAGDSVASLELRAFKNTYT